MTATMHTSSASPFAEMLRRRRQVAGLSQAALAERAGLSTDTVAALERGRRAAPRPDTLALLANALALGPAERTAFVAAARGGGSPGQEAESAQRPLPQAVTALIGRDRELAELVYLLRHGGVRLLTLTGPGGVGKTRLALAVAATLHDDFADGVVVVDLSALSDPALTPSAIARAVGAREVGVRPTLELVAGQLRTRQTLLVLDNFEQLTPAAPLLAGMVAACPRLVVLVTSRTALHLEMEQPYRLEPLALPQEGIAQPAAAAGAAAVQLFLERAQAVQPSFALTTENVAAVVAICRRLDGLPLAIELAAPRVALLSPTAVLARLRSGLTVLTQGARDLPDRQRTLRATLDWSYDLLVAEQRVLFRRLAVFVGGATSEAVTAVCDAQGEPAGAGGTAALIEQSLLRTEGDQIEPRVGLLETIREYASERLEHSGEADALREAHARYYLELAERAAAELDGPLQGIWLARLEQEHDNLRAALGWTFADAGPAAVERHALGLRLGIALWRFWQIHGHFREGRAWLERLLAADAGDQRAGAVARRAAALAGAGRLAHSQADFTQAAQRLEESLALYRALGHDVGMAEVLLNRGLVAHARGEYAEAAALLTASLALQQSRGDRTGTARTLFRLALVTRERGDYPRAAALYTECLACYRDIGDRVGMAMALLGMSDIARDRGDAAETARYGEESLGLFRALGERWGIGCSLNNLGLAAYHRGDLVRAAALCEESLAVFRALAVESSVAEELISLGRIASDLGEDERASVSLAEGLRLAKEGGPRWLVAAALEALAALAARRGQAAAGARWLGAAAALRERMGAPRWPADREHDAATVTALRTALAAERFAAAWAQGQTRPLDRTIADALAWAGGRNPAAGWADTA